jgi:ubiquinone/menaquinone biosynthesis C-methylase UbiE
MTTTTMRDRSGGLVMHAAARHYDRLAWLLTLGRERALRERMADLAGLAPGESVLDVGCGTGALALVARQRVGPSGAVHGVDASPEMIAQAIRKAATARLRASFQVARAQALPFPTARFDVVLCTLMLHHLPRAVRDECAREIRRVLRPGGRVLAVDFEPPPAPRRGGLLSRLHRHGHVPLHEIVELLGRAELRVEERGSVGLLDLRFAVARAPGAADDDVPPSPDEYRTLAPLPAPRWLVPAALAALAAGPVLVLRVASSALVVPALVLVAGIVALALAHGPAAVGTHRARRRR